MIKTGRRWDREKMDYVKRKYKVVEIPIKEKFIAVKLGDKFAVSQMKSDKFKTFDTKGEALAYKSKKMKLLREKYR